MVASLYIPNPEKKPIVNHKDGVKSNNNVSNLEWNTYSENSRHAHDTGLTSQETPVVQIDKDTGEELRVFPSQASVVRILGEKYTYLYNALLFYQDTFV